MKENNIMITTSKRTMYITREDMTRLRSLIAEVKDTREDLTRLRAELDQARVVAPEDIPDDVVTMNSRARLRDQTTREIMTFTLVFPENASMENNRISVLAPIGAAMLGQREKDEVEWEVPAGTVHLKVMKVLYQPEASRHFYL